MPPRNAAGMDVVTNGHVRLRSRCFAREKATRAAPATKRFKMSAVVDIVVGTTAKNESTARYPEAPPCPTDEYRNATPRNRSEMIMVVGRENSIEIFLRACSVPEKDVFLKGEEERD
jgi:hypothetical protein